MTDAECLALARPETTELIGDLLGRGSSVRIRVTGRSMAPLLKGGEVLTIEPAGASTLRLGDIVLFRREGPVIHRLVRREGPPGARVLFFKGDATSVIDGPVQPGDVLGRVVSIGATEASGGHDVRLDDPGRRAAALRIVWRWRAKQAARRLRDQLKGWMAR